MEFHWIDLFQYLQWFEIYFKNSRSSLECLRILIEAQQEINCQNKNFIKNKNFILEKFMKQNKCCINNQM